jgi:hypothetical protein
VNQHPTLNVRRSLNGKSLLPSLTSCQLTHWYTLLVLTHEYQGMLDVYAIIKYE